MIIYVYWGGIIYESSFLILIDFTDYRSHPNDHFNETIIVDNWKSMKSRLAICRFGEIERLFHKKEES